MIHKPVNRYYSGFRAFVSVMRGLVPRIHVFRAATKTWMTGTSPVMTISDSIRPNPALVTGYLGTQENHNTKSRLEAAN